ncbi:MAG: alpha/beta hydrolase [Ignavibacteriaceae bacterium]
MKTIIFIHGLGGNESKTWGNFKNIIKNDSDFSKYNIQYFNYSSSRFKLVPFKKYAKIQTLADGLKTEIFTKYQDDEVILVAHSMGGLIARKYLVNEVINNRAINVNKLLLFATPNNGSELAKIPNVVTRITTIPQMRKNSDFLESLMETWKALGLNNFVQTLYVAGDEDKIVNIQSAHNYWDNDEIQTLTKKNHRDIIQPANENDSSYIIFKKFVFSVDRYKIQTFKKPEKYYKRKIIKAEDYNSNKHLVWGDKLLNELQNVINTNNKISLLAGAGEGKTRELEYLAWELYSNQKDLFPIKVNLKDYNGGDIKTIFPKNWERIPKEKLFLILDGLDEIESQLSDRAKRSIESFAEAYPMVKILLTCRTNFYLLPTIDFLGTLKGFEPFYILKLTNMEINNIILSELKDDKDNFLNLVSRKNINHLLTIPFYLKFLLQIYNDNEIIPDSVGGILDNLIEKKITEDIKKYRNIYPLSEKKEIIIKFIKKMAICMEVLGKNYFSEEAFTYFDFTTDEIELRKYIGLINKRNSNNNTIWEFDHNNFQEYLTAKVLAEEKLEIIKQFISFPPRYNKIIPSWVNTLSFLSSLFKGNKLLEWLIEIQPDVIVKFEKDKLPLELKKKVFKDIFESYKNKKIWINIEKYNLSELSELAEDEESILYLLNELEIDQYYKIKGNSVIILGSMKNPPVQLIENIKESLLTVCISSNDISLVTECLDSFTNPNYRDQIFIDQLISKFKDSENSGIRSSLYQLIYYNDFVNEYIDVFLNGLRFIKLKYSDNTDGRFINEGYNLSTGLEKATSNIAMKKLLSYFIEQPEDWYEIISNETDNKIAENISILINNGDTEINDLLIKLFIILGGNYPIEEAKSLIICFKNAVILLEDFRILLKRDLDPDTKYGLLSLISNKECINLIFEECKNNKISNDELILFRSFLLGYNNEMFNYFTANLEIHTGRFIKIPLQRDFAKENESLHKRDIEMLFDKELFKKEIKLIFDNIGRGIISSDEIHKIKQNNWPDHKFANKAINVVMELSPNGYVNYNSIENYINKLYSDESVYIISEVYEILSANNENILDTTQIDLIKNWCSKHLYDIDFRTALKVGKNGRQTTSTTAIYLHFFLIRLNLDYPKDVLLDMLSFDWEDKGIGYLENKIKPEDIKKRIILNFREYYDNLSPLVLMNYFNYGKKRQLKEFIQFALKTITNMNILLNTRISALEMVVSLSSTNSELEQILPECNDEFKWKVIEKLHDGNSNILENYLLTLLDDDEDEDKMKASRFLIEIQNLKGLEYYTKQILNERKYIVRHFDRRPLAKLKIIEALPFLLQLLDINYDKDFYYENYNDLYSDVLHGFTSISMQSEENFNLVNEKINEFIHANESQYNNVNNLHGYLERLEQQFYAVKSSNITNEEALNKIKLINFI